MGTFEVTMTNETTFETAIYIQHTGKKLSIDDARFIYFDVNDIVDEIFVYLHASIILEKYNWKKRHISFDLLIEQQSPKGNYTIIVSYQRVILLIC